MGIRTEASGAETSESLFSAALGSYQSDTDGFKAVFKCEIVV